MNLDPSRCNNSHQFASLTSYQSSILITNYNPVITLLNYQYLPPHNSLALVAQGLYRSRNKLEFHRLKANKNQPITLSSNWALTLIISLLKYSVLRFWTLTRVISLPK